MTHALRQHCRCFLGFRATRAFLLLILIGLLAAPRTANGTILFAGGEDADFINLTNASPITTAGTFVSGFARESMQVAAAGGCNSGAGYSPPIYYFMTPTFTSNSIIWIHANMNLPGVNPCSPPNPSDVLGAYSPDGNARIVVQQSSASGSTGQFNIYTRNAAGTQTLLVSMTSPCFTALHLHTVDFYINYASSGEVTLYCDGAQVADYSGNILTDAATQLNQVQFADFFANGSAVDWSEIIVATTSTRNMRLVTLAPAANGNTVNFDTGTVTNVNETTNNTATVNASGTSGQIQEYTVGALPAGTWNVVGVAVNAQAQVDTTGPQHLQAMVRTGATDYTSSNLSPPQLSWGFIENVWTTNPNTSAAWTTTDLGTAGFNIGFESQN